MDVSINNLRSSEIQEIDMHLSQLLFGYSLTYLQTPKPNVIILKNALCTQNRVNVPDLIENQLKYYFKLLDFVNKQPKLSDWDKLHKMFPKFKVKTSKTCHLEAC